MLQLLVGDLLLYLDLTIYIPAALCLFLAASHWEQMTVLAEFMQSCWLCLKVDPPRKSRAKQGIQKS